MLKSYKLLQKRIEILDKLLIETSLTFPCRFIIKKDEIIPSYDDFYKKVKDIIQLRQFLLSKYLEINKNTNKKILKENTYKK